MQKPLEQASALTLNAISDGWVERVHALAREHFGAADLEGDKLLAAIDTVSRGYTTERASLGAGRSRVSDLIARLKLFTVRDLPKIEVPLTELALRGALPLATDATWRVLDVGAGLGATTLGVARFAARVGVDRVQVHALDRDEPALAVFRALSRDVTALSASPITLSSEVVDLTRAPSMLGARRFELIVVGFVINELWPELDDVQRAERAHEWLTSLTQHLTDDGALIVLEPALREQTRQLQRVRDLLAVTSTAPFVFAPCPRSGPCPMLANERDWCHAQAPFALPKRTAEIARGAGLRDHDLTFSYLTLRKQAGHVGDGPTVSEARPRSVHRVVSALLPSKGKLELMTCSAAGLSRVMRLDRHQSDRNVALSELGRGAVVRLPIAESSGRTRVSADDDVDVVWRWTRRT